MENKKGNMKFILPVLLSYLVMGFVDIVGVSVGYAQRDFDLSPEVAQLLPSMVFIWFFLLSLPVGVLQHNYGKRKALLIGIFTTAVGMFLPFVVYNFPILLVSFVLLGIGNTIIQVSSNPLLQDVVRKDRFSSYMSLSQFVKAVSSLMGPLIVTFMVAQYNNWMLVFLVYGITSIISGAWLAAVSVEESKSEITATFKSALSLLNNGFIAKMVLAIFLVVGLDVGMNTSIQNLLTGQFGVSLESASLGISLYFGALMVSRFAGAILLTKVDNLKFLLWSGIITLAAVVGVIFAPTHSMALAFIFLFGLGSGNLFPLIFSLTINRKPDRANEISGLMVMAIVGGAVVPPVMGLVNKSAGVRTSFVVLVLCAIYVLFTYIWFSKRAVTEE